MTKEAIKNLVIIILIIGLLFFGNSYLENKRLDRQEAREQELMINASNFGYTTALQEVYSLGKQCRQIPLSFGNNTITLVALECMQGR